MSFLTGTLLGAYGLLWRAARPALRRNKRLSDGFAARLSPPKVPEAAENNPCIWIQAASGGEAKLAEALVPALTSLPASPEALTVVCTTHTRQGLDVLQGLAASPAFIGKHTLVTGYVPFDQPALMRQTVRALNPRAIILLETELWPGLLYAARLHNVPVAVLNGRMTEKSLARYAWLRSFWREHAPERISAISDADAARFAELFGKERVSTMRNIKFDHVAEAMRSAGAGEVPDPRAPFTVAFASVREEEEAVLLPVVAALHALPIPVRILIAPRHMHRVEAWKGLLAGKGLSFVLRSSDAPHSAALRSPLPCPSGREAPLSSDVLPESGDIAPAIRAAGAERIVLWDTFGELRRVYERADEVFVGGSLAPLGGQNFLEAAAEGTAPLVGPHLENFLWAGDAFFAQGLGRRVASAEELADILSERATVFTVGTNNAGERAVRKQEVRRRFAAWLESRTGGTRQAAEAVLSMLHE